MLILECSQESYRVQIRSCDLDLWPWKSIGFQILFRTKYAPSLVKIHWRMLILECSQGCYGRTDRRTVALLYPFAASLARGKQGQRKAWRIPSPKNLTQWPWKSIGFQILLRTKYAPSLVKIHWRMLILECSQGCYGRAVALVVTISLRNFVGERIINKRKERWHVMFP